MTTVAPKKPVRIHMRYVLLMVCCFLIPPIGSVLYPDFVPFSLLMANDVIYLSYVLLVGILLGAIGGVHSVPQQPRSSGDPHRQ